jgi:hypothetical protein
MTSDGNLTKEELQSTTVSFERDTSNVYAVVSVIVDGQEHAVRVPIAGAPNGREHGPCTVVLYDAWGRLADEIENRELESSDEPQAK